MIWLRSHGIVSASKDCSFWPHSTGTSVMEKNTISDFFKIRLILISKFITVKDDYCPVTFLTSMVIYTILSLLLFLLLYDIASQPVGCNRFGVK